MQVKSIAECSKGILQYFRSSLSYDLSLRSFFFFFEWPLKTSFTVVPVILTSLCVLTIIMLKPDSASGKLDGDFFSDWMNRKKSDFFFILKYKRN